MTREEADTLVRYINQNRPRLRARREPPAAGHSAGWSVCVYDPERRATSLEIGGQLTMDQLRERLDAFARSVGSAAR